MPFIKVLNENEVAYLSFKWKKQKNGYWGNNKSLLRVNVFMVIILNY